MKIYRQGDVLLVEVELDKEYVLSRARREDLVIEGENGHRHILEGVYVARVGETTLIVVDDVKPLKHDEHPWIWIEPGIYMLRFVRDYALMNRRPLD